MKRKPFLSRICLKNVILQILKLSDLNMYLSVNLANIVTINQNVIRQNKKKIYNVCGVSKMWKENKTLRKVVALKILE